MHDRHHEHEHEHGHEHSHGHEHTHEHSHGGEAVPESVKLRKMAEHWIGHNEEHARSYRQWANRAKDAGHEEPAAILEEIAFEIAEQNERFKKIIHLLDSAGEEE